MLQRRHVLSAAAAIGGVAVFVWVVRRAGAGEIADGIRRVGWGLVPILAVSGLRFAVRAQTWRLCMPPASRLPFFQTFQAYLASDAVGNVTPLGLLASEPTKVMLTRHHLATSEAVTSLAADNLLYAASAATMIAIGAVVMLTTVPMPFGWRDAVIVALAAAVVLAAVGVRMMRGTWSEARGERPAWRQRLAGIRESVVGTFGDDRGRALRVFGLHMCFHALALLEVFLTLRWLLPPSPDGFGGPGGGPTLTQVIVFGAVDRVTIILFKVVPLRVGVDEVVSGALAPVLAVQAAHGVTLAVVRKVRSVFWMAIGLLLIAAHPAREAPATDRRGSASGHRS